MSKKPSKASDELGNVSIDQKLIEEGTAQLTSEIKVLEAWLEELAALDNGDAEVIAARKSYNDMLRSRKEMLNSLAKKANLQAVSHDQRIRPSLPQLSLFLHTPNVP